MNNIEELIKLIEEEAQRLVARHDEHVGRDFPLTSTDVRKAVETGVVIGIHFACAFLKAQSEEAEAFLKDNALKL